MTQDSDSTVRASPGPAAAAALPDPADLRNHVQVDDEGHTPHGIHGD